MVLLLSKKHPPIDPPYYEGSFEGPFDPVSGTVTDTVTGALYRLSSNGGNVRFLNSYHMDGLRGALSTVVYQSPSTFRGEIEHLSFRRPALVAAATVFFLSFYLRFPSGTMGTDDSQDVLAQMHSTASVPWQFNNSVNPANPSGPKNLTYVISAPNPQTGLIGPQDVLQPFDTWVWWGFRFAMSTVAANCEMTIYRNGQEIYHLPGSSFIKPFLIAGLTNGVSNEAPKLKTGLYKWRWPQLAPEDGVGTTRAVWHDRVRQGPTLASIM